MIFSKPRAVAGQSSLETVLALTILCAIAFTGTGLLVQRLGTLVLVKWAAVQSRCVAIKRDPVRCKDETRRQLQSWFAFKNVQIKNRERHGIIHTEIRAELMGSLQARYDMGPSEYSRVRP